MKTLFKWLWSILWQIVLALCFMAVLVALNDHLMALAVAIFCYGVFKMWTDKPTAPPPRYPVIPSVDQATNSLPKQEAPYTASQAKSATYRQ